MALTNNDIIKKLRVALSLRDSDIVEILKLVDFNISKSELSAFFRADDHEKFMPLKDQILRNFLNGLVIHKRGKMERKPKTDATEIEQKEKMPPKQFRKPLGVTPKKLNVNQIGGVRFKVKGK